MKVSPKREAMIKLAQVRTIKRKIRLDQPDRKEYKVLYPRNAKTRSANARRPPAQRSPLCSQASSKGSAAPGTDSRSKRAGNSSKSAPSTAADAVDGPDKPRTQRRHGGTALLPREIQRRGVESAVRAGIEYGSTHIIDSVRQGLRFAFRRCCGARRRVASDGLLRPDPRQAWPAARANRHRL